MRIVGLKQDDGTVLVGALRSNGTEVVVFADVEDFGRPRTRWSLLALPDPRFRSSTSSLSLRSSKAPESFAWASTILTM